MKPFAIWLTCLEPGEENPVKVVAEFRAPDMDSAVNSAAFHELSKILEDANITKRMGRPGRPVICVDIDFEIFERWVKGDPSVVDNRTGNFVPPQMVDYAQVWPNARTAAKHLGFHNQEVSVALNKLAIVPDRDDRRVTLRGVTLMYKDDFDSKEL
jgi:hypothetical protein